MVVLDPTLHLADLRYQLVQVFLVVHEIDGSGVDDQKGCLIVVEEEVVVGLVHLVDVGFGYLGLVVAVASADAFHERSRLGLQKYDQVTLCDYIFPKDKIFAYLNLDDSELLIYDKLYALLEEQVPKPDLVIYLQAETKTLVERIRGRNRDYERDISEAYINEVNKAYNYFFFHYNQTPLLVIDTTSIDFVRHEHHLDELVEQIRKMEHGVQYYQPLGSST